MNDIPPIVDIRLPDKIEPLNSYLDKFLSEIHNLERIRIDEYFWHRVLGLFFYEFKIIKRDGLISADKMQHQHLIQIMIKDPTTPEAMNICVQFISNIANACIPTMYDVKLLLVVENKIMLEDGEKYYAYNINNIMETGKTRWWVSYFDSLDELPFTKNSE